MYTRFRLLRTKNFWDNKKRTTSNSPSGGPEVGAATPVYAENAICALCGNCGFYAHFSIRTISARCANCANCANDSGVTIPHKGGFQR